MPHSTISQNATIDGHQIDVIPLETIDYERLATKDPAEVEKLLGASQMPGFFHLDLQNESGKQILAGLQEVYGVTGKYYDAPPEGRAKEYKPGERGGDFEVSPPQRQCSQFDVSLKTSQILRDQMVHGKLALPNPLDEHSKLLERFLDLCHSVNKTMLARLSDALKLDGASRFENTHRDDKPSETALNLISAPAKNKRADQPDTTHTDGGSLTILFCEEWGNMIEHPETKAWGFVEPKPGCALINVADALQALSGNKLHSCRHAVTQPVDGFLRRYYVVYYLRPEMAE